MQVVRGIKKNAKPIDDGEVHIEQHFKDKNIVKTETNESKAFIVD